MKKSFFKSCLTAVLAAALAGCSGTASTAPSTTNSTSQNSEKKILIGLAMHNQTSDWPVQFYETFKEEAEKAGVELAMTDANAVAANQVSQIEDLTSQGVDVIVFLPADYSALGQALKTAHDAGVKLVNADSKVVEEDRDNVDVFVSADAYSAGYIAGEWFAENLPQGAKLGTLEKSILSVVADRFTGMRAALKEKGRDDIILVPKEITTSAEVASNVEDMLMVDPDIAAYLALNDAIGLTAYSTCVQMGHPDVQIIGFDGSPAGKQSIAAGELAGSMVYSPVDLAKTSFDAALKLAKGESVEREMYTEMYLIDKTNIDQYDIDKWN